MNIGLIEFHSNLYLAWAAQRRNMSYYFKSIFYSARTFVAFALILLGLVTLAAPSVEKVIYGVRSTRLL